MAEQFGGSHDVDYAPYINSLKKRKYTEETARNFQKVFWGYKCENKNK